MKKSGIAGKLSCAVLSGALVIGQVLGSVPFALTARAEEAGETEKVWKATKLVTNGDFETGDTSGWTVGDSTSADLNVKVDGYASNNTTNILNYYSGSGNYVDITQTISAVPEGTYKLSTGFVKKSKKQYYVKKGIVRTDYTGFVKKGKNHYYVKNGIFQSRKCAIIKSKKAGKRYYVKNGKIARTVTGTVKVAGKKYKVVKGVVNLCAAAF